jgi:hypothetical protein
MSEGPKLILLNGPAGSGKTTSAKILSMEFNIPFMHVAETLKTRTCGLFNTRHEWRWYEDKKDEPLEDFLGLSPRQAYIFVSEEVLKKKFGQDIIGRLVATQVAHYFAFQVSNAHLPVMVLDSFSFIDELRCLKVVTDIRNMLIIRLYRQKHTFENDSRGYIMTENVRTVDVENDNDIVTLEAKLKLLVNDFLGSPGANNPNEIQ